MITTLSPDILAKVRAAILDAGETDSNDYLHDQLHEVAQDRAEDLLREHCSEIQHLDEIDDDQRTELIQAYKDGFWEPTHLSERNALKAALVRIRDYPAGSNSDPDVMGNALDEIQRLAREVLESFTLPPVRVVICMEGGLITGVLSDGSAKVMHLDYDVEGALPEDIVQVPQWSKEETEPAYLAHHEPELKPARVEELFTLPLP